jgi:tetratricopeptide (TPR) repeat protein
VFTLFLLLLKSFLKRIRKEYKRAEEYYFKAIEVDAQDVSNLGNYANFLRNCKHNHEMACIYFEKALSLCPSHLNNLAQYASLLTEMKRYDQADQIYQQVLDQLTRNQETTTNGTTSTSTSQLKEDNQVVEDTSGTHPTGNSTNTGSSSSPPLLQQAYIIGNYANLCRKSGRFQDAKALYLQALALDPDNELITRNL